LIEVLSQILPEGTEENHKVPHSGLPVSQPKFEPNTYRIQALNLEQAVRYRNKILNVAVHSHRTVVAAGGWPIRMINEVTANTFLRVTLES
jgi:hypothetical protein